MNRKRTFRLPAARTMRAARILGLLAALGGPALAGDSPSVSPASPQIAQPATAPSWRDLSPAQKQALAPLVGEWDSIDVIRKEKWLNIGNRFATMKPEEQQRAQEKMRDWAKLTPAQRKTVRENYARAKKITPDQKSAQWQQYQQLSDEQKQKLAAIAPVKKGAANLPAHTPAQTVPAIKAAPKPAVDHKSAAAVAGKSMIEASVPPKKQDNH